MGISVIYAVSKNGVIGQNNTIPWYLSDELKYFSRVTRDSILIMGRKTYESLPNKTLPDRHLVVVSKDHSSMINASAAPINVVAVGDIKEAMLVSRSIQRISGSSQVFFIGGKEIIVAGLKEAGTLYVTEVDIEVSEDPSNIVVDPVDLNVWELKTTEYYKDTKTGILFTTMKFVKK